MNCEHPVIAVDLWRGQLDKNGKRSLKIIGSVGTGKGSLAFGYSIDELERKYGKENVFRLPCGRCTACKEAYRADWSVRCDMEARYHKENCFITLTYRKEFCPRWVSKAHVRRFIRKLRKATNKTLSYFACGEYGESVKTPLHPEGRPHYHLILFGYFPDDAVLKPDVKSNSGFEVYESKFLNELWNKGFVDVNNFSQDTAFYVAGYVNKKTGKYDGFLNMSNGIGYQYMIDNIHELFIKRTYVARSGRVHFLPRAFKRICEKLGYFHEEDPITTLNLRMMENSEMIVRGISHREDLTGIVGLKMKDKLEKRRKRL